MEVEIVSSPLQSSGLEPPLVEPPSVEFSVTTVGTWLPVSGYVRVYDKA